MPIINAPFRLYYAYNPLRLYEKPYCNSVIVGGKTGSCSAELITRDMFPPGGAGDYTYQEALQAYGSRYLFREPRKTFRLTVSTPSKGVFVRRFHNTPVPHPFRALCEMGGKPRTLHHPVSPATNTT